MGRQREIIISTVAIVLIIVFALLTAVQAHEWYPQECCSGQDCAPVEKVEVMPALKAGMWTQFNPRMPTVMVVTTKHGTAMVPDNLTRRQSQDNQMHACLHAGRLICIFMPPGN